MRRHQEYWATMDETDRAILRTLQVDGRIPYAELGPAATEGVERVEDSPYFAIHTHRFLWDVG